MHIVIAGTNYHPTMVTSEKVFWMELIPNLAEQGVSEVTIVSALTGLPPEADQTSEASGVRINLRYVGGSDEFNSGITQSGLLSTIRHRIYKYNLLGTVRSAITEIVARSAQNGNPVTAIQLIENLGPYNHLIHKSTGLPTIVSTPTNFAPSVPFFDKLLSSSLIRDDLHVVTCSAAFRDWLAHHGAFPENLSNIRWGTAIPSGPISEELRIAAKESLGLDPSIPLVTWAGYIQQIGNDELWKTYEMAHQVLGTGANMQFMFALKPSAAVGPSIPEVDSDRIQLRFTDQEQFTTVRHATDVHLSFTDNYRSFMAPPLTWIQMLSHGVPILTLNTPGSDEVVDHTCGAVATSTEEMITLLPSLVERAKELRTSSHKRAASIGSIQRAAKDYAELWKRLSRVDDL